MSPSTKSDSEDTYLKCLFSFLSMYQRSQIICPIRSKITFNKYKILCDKKALCHSLTDSISKQYIK